MPASTPKLEIPHHEAILSFACEHKEWANEWSRVFSDESRFCIDFVIGRKMMWRNKGKHIT